MDMVTFIRSFLPPCCAGTHKPSCSHESVHGYIRLGLFVCIGLLGVGCQNHQPSSDRLTMLTAPDYCPYEFRLQLENGKSELAGFDIDLAQAIANELGRSLTIESKHFNQIMLALEQQQADFSMAAITPTRERQAVVNFSNIYYAQSMAIVSRYDQPLTTLESLIQKTVGVRNRSFHAKELNRYSEIHQVSFNSSEELIAAVKAKQVDAIILDRAIAPKYVTPASQLTWSPARATTARQGVAIAFPKLASRNLQMEMNQALETLNQDGTMRDLIHKWFDAYQCPLD